MQLLSVHSGAEPYLPIIVPTGWSSSRGLLASAPRHHLGPARIKSPVRGCTPVASSLGCHRCPKRTNVCQMINSWLDQDSFQGVGNIQFRGANGEVFDLRMGEK
jgi:hypothetical protein